MAYRKGLRSGAHKHEQQQIEASIWEQIDSGNENDYIHFHLRKANGTYFSVLDHGRIVESPQYGKVFYVLFMDWEDMQADFWRLFSATITKCICVFLCNARIQI